MLGRDGAGVERDPGSAGFDESAAPQVAGVVVQAGVAAEAALGFDECAGAPCLIR